MDVEAIQSRWKNQKLEQYDWKSQFVGEQVGSVLGSELSMQQEMQGQDSGQWQELGQ